MYVAIASRPDASSVETEYIQYVWIRTSYIESCDKQKSCEIRDKRMLL